MTSNAPTKSADQRGSPPSPRLILASGSRIRAQLLSSAGVSFEKSPARIDETRIIQRASRDGLAHDRLAIDLAEAKAQTGDSNRDTVILGSDQLLVFEGEIFETPPSRDEAIDRLRQFSGKSHQLVCGFALRRNGETIASGSRITHIHMRVLSDAMLAAYADQAAEALVTTVGGYEIEGLGLQLIDHMEGDYFAALGLPMFDVLSALRTTGVLPLS